MEKFLSTDIFHKVLTFLTPIEIIRLRVISKTWRDLISRARSIWGTDYDTFVANMLNISDENRELILNGTWSIALGFEICAILAEGPTKRALMLFGKNYKNELLKPYVRPICSWSTGTILLKEGLMTVDQITKFDLVSFEEVVSLGNIVTALRENLITPEELAAFPTTGHIRALRQSVNALKALREGLITPKQIMSFQDSNGLQYLFKLDHSLVALREGLITVEQILLLPNSLYLHALIKDKSRLKLLSEGLITIEQIAAFPDYRYVECTFCTRGYHCLKEKLITPEHIASFPNYQYVEALFGTETGYMLLKKSPTFPEDIQYMSLDKLTRTLGYSKFKTFY